MYCMLQSRHKHLLVEHNVTRKGRNYFIQR